MAHGLKSQEYLRRLVALSPTAANRGNLADTLRLLGNLYAFSLNRPDDATKVLNESLEISRTLMPEFANGNVSSRSYFLAATELASILNNQERYDDAERLLKEVAPFAASLRAKYRDRVFLGQSAMHMSLSAGIQARKGNHAAASKAIPTMLAIDADNSFAYLNAACILNHCILAVEKDTKISDQVRKDLTAAYTERAMDYLMEGFSRGNRNHEQLAKDPDLEVFRKHPVFQRVLAEMRKAKDASPKPREEK